MSFFFRVVFILLITTSTFASDPAKHVNTFIGTGGHGHTFPGSTVPFGMVQLSPDTRVDNWDGSGGYHYSDDVIYGFSHTHLSGTGIPDYCDLLVMPTVGGPGLSEFKGKRPVDFYKSKFSHENETSAPGYYSVKLDRGEIDVELTTTKRVGFHKYTFPKTKESAVYLDLRWRDEVLDSQLKVVGKNKIAGFRRSSSWARDQIVYFYGEFSKDFKSYDVMSEGKVSKDTSRSKSIVSKFDFDTTDGEPVYLKMAISPVDLEGAKKNLKKELSHWNFEKVKKDARKDWNKELSKIEVSGGTKAEFTNFYTALYHTMIAPNTFSDVDGRYRGMDGKVRTLSSDLSSKLKVRGSGNPLGNHASGNRGPNAEKQTLNVEPRTSNDTSHYTVFSLWDTYRATHPLYSIIDEKRTVEFINTFIRQYEQGGKLPVWELAGNETETMIGYHAVSVIADTMAKGIKGFDYKKAYEAAKHSSNLDIEGLDSFRKRGYISMEDEHESVSRTLEYSYNAYCIAMMAKILANTRKRDMERTGLSMAARTRGLDKVTDALESDHERYLNASQYYKNIYDKETGFMRPKQNGNWASPFDPREVTFHFTEANAWQYTFHVTQDVGGLIALFGGKKQFVEKLDGLFTAPEQTTGRFQPDITGLIGQYAHGNEPSHHIAYLYNYADRPSKTQFYVRKIMDEFYKPTPDGLIGNEDCGQMSAWYVLSALGFYPVNPSDPVYEVGTPIFDKAVINLENGKKFVVEKKGEGIYVDSLKLNEKDHRLATIAHKDIRTSSTLSFQMTKKPNDKWFTKRELKSISTFKAVPTIEGDRVFQESTLVALSTPENSPIRYTIDGSEPTAKSFVYYKPISVYETTKIRAAVFENGMRRSMIAESTLNKRPNDWEVILFSKYSTQYTGGGPVGLIDGLRGTTNFASGEWQGYQGQDFEAIIDLKRSTEINELGASFLQVARSWIWMPTKIEFETSDDGENYKKVLELPIVFPEREMIHTIREYSKKIDRTRARYLRVKAKNFGKIPEWHPGAGSDAYIFVDEVFVK